MQRIFDDERRQNGGFQRGPSGVGSKSLLNASKMLDGGEHRLALFEECRDSLPEILAGKGRAEQRVGFGVVIGLPIKDAADDLLGVAHAVRRCGRDR